MLKKKISVKDKYDSYCMSFNTKELTENVTEDSTKPNSFVVENKRVWMKEEKPKIIKEIDSQLRKRFSIGNNKLVTSLYYPPVDSNKVLTINEPKSKVLTRIIISTIDETPIVTFGNYQGEKLPLKSWVAYKAPPLVGSSLTYEFDNSKVFTSAPKKGFRTIRKSKNVKNRYILLFDYLLSKEDLEVLSEQLAPVIKKSNISQEEVDKALKSLEN